MSLTVSNVLLALLLVSCFGSFSWAVRRFFVRPERTTPGLKFTLLAGTAFAIIHLVVILRAPLLAPWAVAAGAALYCLSLAVFWWAIAANRVKPLAACFSTESQLHLVRHGPYRLVRHPFYCSYLLAWLAGAVATLNIWLALTAIIMFVLYLSAAVNEENKFASSPLAEEYENYRGSTGRFFPKPFSLLTRHPH